MSKIRLLVCLAVLAIVAPAWSQVAQNGADWYRRAIARLDALPEDVLTTLRDYAADPSGPPSAEVRAALDQARPALVPLTRAARLPYADFGLDYSRGFSLELPHLGQVRNLVRIARADVAVSIHDGNSAVAADRLADLYRVSTHFNDDGIVISSLVGRVVFAGVDQTVQFGLDHAAFDASDSAKLLEGISDLETSDPFAMAEAIVGEQEMAMLEMSRHGDTAEARAEFADQMAWMGDDDDRANAFAELSDEQFEDAVAEYDAVMTEIGAAFLDPDREAGRAKLAEIDGNFEEGVYGPIAMMLTPALLRVFDHMVEAEAELAARIELFKKLAQGEVRPEDEANAAIEYLRMIDVLGAWPDTRLTSLRVAAARNGSADDELQVALADAGMVETLISTSRLRRCDFGPFRPRDNVVRLVPAYAPGFRDLVRCLLVDAARLARDGHPERARANLGAAVRMSAHLGPDEPIFSSVVAHDAFLETRRAIDGVVGPASAATEREDLIAALRRHTWADPFGYLSSAESSRQTLASTLRRLQDPDVETPSVDSVLREWGPERLARMTAILASLRDETEEDDTMPAITFASIAHLVDIDTWRNGPRGEVTTIVEHLANGRLDAVADGTTPLIDIGPRVRGSRSDLREAMRFLTDEEEPTPDP